MTFYKTSSYIATQIEIKEKELRELRILEEHAKVREFYWHINEQLRVMDEKFYNTEWTISFGNKSVTLPNCAEVFQGIEQVLFDYMEEENILHKDGEGE